MPSVSKKIFRSFIQMFTGSGINFISSLVSGYFFALFLGPAIYGIWQTARVFLSYSTFTSLGIPFAMRRDFITLRSEGKFAEAEKLAHVSITYSFIVNPLLGLVFIGIAIFSDSQIALKVSIFLVGLMYITELFTGIGNLIHKGINDYKTLAIGDTIYGIGLILLIPFVFYFGYFSLLAGYFVISVARSAFFFLKRPIPYKWDLDFPVLKKLIFSAFPLFLVTIISTVFISIDRLLIAGLLDFENVGLYSLSTFIAQPMTLLLSSFSIVNFTHLNEKYGKSKSPHVLEKHVYIPQKFFSDILPPVIGCGVVALPLLTELLLPKYQGGILAAQLNVFAILFLKLAGFSSSGLFILDKLKYAAISFFIAGCIKTTGSYIALKAGYGIESVSLFTLIAYFIYNTLMLYHVNKSLGNQLHLFFKRLSESLVCPLTILLFCVVYLIFSKGVYEFAGIDDKWIQMLIGILMVLLLSSGFLFRAYTNVKWLFRK